MSQNTVEFNLDANVKPLIASIREAMGTTRKQLEDLNKSAPDIKIKADDSSIKRIDAQFRKASKGANEFSRTSKKATDTLSTGAKKSSVFLDSLNRRIRETGQASYNARSGVSSLVRSLAGFATASISIYAVGNAIRSVISTGAEFESLSITLESLMGNAQGGEQALSWIKEFAKDTPLQLQGVTDGFIKLKAFGLDPMDGTYQSLVDANAKLGGDQEKLNGIILATGQAWAKGKLQGEEILQLVERGIPVWDKLAKVTGKSNSELQDMSANGELTRDVIKKLVDELGRDAMGSASKQMKTFNGLASNAKDQWSQFLDLIADSGTLDYFKQILQDILDEVDRMKETGELQQLARDISDGIVAIASAVKSLIVTLYDWREELALIAKIWLGMKIVDMVSGIKTMASSVGGLASALGTGAGALALFAKRLAPVAALMAGFEAGQWSVEKAFSAFGIGTTTEELDSYMDSVGKTTKAVGELRKAQELLRSQGDEAGANQLEALVGQIYTKKISIEDALEVSRVLKEQNQERLNDDKKKALESTKVAEVADGKKLASARKNLESAQTALKSALTKETQLRETQKKQIEDLEKKHAKSIEDVYSNLANKQTSLLDKMASNYRNTLSDADKEKQLIVDIDALMQASRYAVLENNAAKAKGFAERAEGLADELQGYENTQKALLDLKTLYDQIAYVEINDQEVANLAEKAKLAEDQLKETDKANKSVADAKEDLKSVANEVARLQGVGNVGIEVISDSEQAKEDLAFIQSELKKLAKGIVIPITTSGGGADNFNNAPGFNTGGHIPGYGGGDTVRALLERGEYVVRKEAVNKFGLGFLEQLNAGSLSPVSGLTVPSVPKYNTGGLVNPSGETINLSIDLGSGSSSTVSGSRLDINGLVGALREIEARK